MVRFHRKTTENETKQDKKRELECEEAIINEKERFGRVRNAFMGYLREEYGVRTVDKAVWRVNRRITEGYFGKIMKNRVAGNTWIFVKLLDPSSFGSARLFPLLLV